MSLLLSSRCWLAHGCWVLLFGGLFVLSPLPAQAQQPRNIAGLINAYVTKGRPSKEDPAKQEVKNQLLKALQQALANVTSNTELYAVATLIEELAEKEYDKSGDKLINDEDQKLTRSLTDNLLALAQKGDWRTRYVALRALGKITPDPEKVIPVMKSTLESGGTQSSVLEPRRVAAYALTDLARYAHLLPLSQIGKETFIPVKQLKTIAQVTHTANVGMSDTDELVRGYSILAVVEAVNSFTSRILPYQKPPDPAAPRRTKPVFEERGFDLTNKEYRDEVLNIVDEFALVNAALLSGLQDANFKIRLASLEAIDQIANGRATFLQYARTRESFPDDERQAVFRYRDDKSGKYLKIAEIELRDDKMKVLSTEEIKIKDPLRQIVAEDRGQSIVRMLEPGTDLKLRRKAIHILELLATDLQLFQDDPQETILRQLAGLLNDPQEDVFLRWSAVNIIYDLVRNQDERLRTLSQQAIDKKVDESEYRAEQKRPENLLRKVLGNNLDVSLSNVAIARHPYADQDLARAALAALEELGYLTRIVADSELEKRRLGAEFVSLLQNLFFITCDGRSNYDPGIRYDVETRIAALRVVVSIGGIYVKDAGEVAIAALEKDPNPRIRRAVAEALGKVGPLSEPIVEALLKTLRHDTDSDVRMTVSETLISAPRSKGK